MDMHVRQAGYQEPSPTINMQGRLRCTHGTRCINRNNAAVFNQNRSRTEGATAFEFKSADGFPPGDFRIDVLIDDASAASRDFKVEGP